MNDKQKLERMVTHTIFLLEFLHLEISEQNLSPMIMHHLSELGKLAKMQHKVNKDEIDIYLKRITE